MMCSPFRAALLLTALPLMTLALLACGGGDPALTRAQETVSASSAAFAEAEANAATAQEADARMTQALADAERRLEQAERMLEHWRASGAGEMGWRTLAPCLARSLEELAEALRAAGHPGATDVEQAQMMAAGDADGSCN